MAFASTITGVKSLGGAKMIYGTWDGTGATSGTITWGKATYGGGAKVMGARVISSNVTNTVTGANTTFWKVTADTLVLGCASNDAGYWSVTLA